MKTYFKGGSGIEFPVDVDGVPIKEGDILTHDWYDPKDVNFFKVNYPNLTQEGIDNIIVAPSVIVKIKDNILFGKGITKSLYMHDFRFKYTKRLCTEQEYNAQHP